MLRLAQISTLLALATFLSASPCHAGDWTQFRGPGGLGVSDAVNLPASWSDTENVLWKTAMPGFGGSSPIILGDRVYLTCYSGYGLDPRNPGEQEDLTRHVVCVKLADGSVVWEKSIKAELPETPYRGYLTRHGYASSTPVTDGQRLFVFFGKSGLFAFDLDGNQLWRADLGTGTHGWGSGSSPILYKNLVIVNANVESRSLIAVNKQTGEEVWRIRGMRQSWNTPHLVELKDEKQELVLQVQGRILGFDPDSGERLWSCEGVPDYVCPSLVSQDGVVYVIGGRRSMAMAVRAGGRGDVTDSHKVWEARVGANVASPVIHDGHLYWVSDRNRIAYCLKLDSGEIVYQQRFGGEPFASAVAADGKLFIVTRFDGVFVLAARPEYELRAHNELGDASCFNASPAVADGQLLIRSDRYLYCIGK